MPKRIISQNSFTAGEITHDLYGRVSVEQYEQGLKTATNCEILPHGPVRRRNGTQFISEIKDSSADTRLLKYQFSKDTAFIIEAGNQYLRFYTNSGQIVESDITISGITQADPAVVTATSHGLSNGDQVYITSVSGMTEVNNSTVYYTVANVTANTFELQDRDGVNVDSTGFTAYSSGGDVNRIYTITSPWTTAQLDDIQYVQSGTTMYLVHPDVTPRQLVRTSNTSWTLSEIVFDPEPTYEAGYAPATTMTPAATTGTGINFTAGAGTFVEADIGRQIVNESDGETGKASITSITSSTVAVCDIIEDFTDTNAIASGDWKLDLSPICDLEFDNIQAGAIVNIRSEYLSGSVGSRQTITNVTSANPGVVTVTSHGYANGEKVQIQDIVGMTQINNKEFTVENVTANTFELKGENTSGYTAYSSGGIVRKVLTDNVIDAFRSDDVDKYILANGGVMQIITVNSATDVDALILKSLNSSDTTGNWTLESPTWDGTRGYPRAVGIYQQRLWFAGTSAQPQTLWGSEIAIREGFGVGPDDEDSIEIELDTNEANKISWIKAGRDLVVGTTGEEITVSSGSSAAVTPSNIGANPQTSSGSVLQQAVKIGDEVVFIDDSTKQIISFRYDFNIDNYRDDNITFLAQHLADQQIKEVAWAKNPNNHLLAITEDGNLITLLYDREKQILAAAQQTTDGTFERVQVIKNTTADQIWIISKRTINSVTRRFVEILTEADGTDDTDGFSDSFLTLSNNLAISSITAANPAVVTTSASHGLSNGDKVIIKDLVDPLASDLDSTKTNMSDLNGKTFTVANKTATTFELSGIDTSGYNAYGSSGNVWLKVSTVSGLDHLEGKTVQIKVDGAAHANKTVSSGSITLDSAAGEVVVGLPYTTTIETLPAEFNIGIGSAQGQRARFARPLLRVYKSTPPTVNSEILPARSGADLMDSKVPLFTGYYKYGPLNWGDELNLTITLASPFPLELQSVTGVSDSGVI